MQNSTPGHVLVVDDVSANVRLLESILMLEDYEVTTASSGPEALEKVGAAAPDVVLLDVMMPGMDGFEVCERLKSDPATANLPVVMVTALRETPDRVRALEAGADDFLTKPVDEIEVVARVKSLVRAKRDRDALDASFGELRAAHDELQRAEEMRDSLTQMLVHDLRTPLTTMMLSLDLLQSSAEDADEDAPPLDEMQREMIGMALRGSNHLLDLVNDLLDIAKMEGGELQIARESVDVAQLFAAARESVATQLGEAEVELDQTIAPDSATIQADGDLLRRVLVNLLGNAIKFTPRAGRIEVSAQLHASGWHLAVRDQGPGIAPQHRERIFEKFGQVEMRAQGERPSTGLGLTFCRLAVEAHGGAIWVESEEGQGSTFRFTLAAPT